MHQLTDGSEMDAGAPALPAAGPSALALFWRGFTISVISILSISLLTGIAAVGVYAYIAMTLPSPAELHERAASFVSTKIYDRHGELLYEVIDPFGGRRTLVRLDEIPLSLRNATIATEDPTFYSNPGFNPLAIARAVWQNVTQREIISGASTITQQLTKLLFIGSEMTLQRKVKEAVLASEVTRTYSKDEILQTYLNEIYYGNLAYGVGAAAETYFGKPVSELSLAESALLVGMAPAPSYYDPYENRDATLQARATVLDRMVKHGYITTAEAETAKNEPLKLAPRRIEMKAPHFVVYVRQLLEQQFGADLVYRGGLQVETTLDLGMQTIAERVASEQIANLAKQKATNASLVAIDPQTGEIRAMLGSVNFANTSIDGQVNVALQPRQPGSSIKPLTYASAFEKGWTPATMVMDVRTKFPDAQGKEFEYKNYDGKEHGPLSVRTALACSYNIPAIKALQLIGMQSLIEISQRLGVTSLNRTDYGLSLTLGGGEVTLLEMTGAYSTFAAGGMWRQPTAILRVKNSAGKLLYQYNAGAGREALDPRIAYQITSILADHDARTPAFGPHSALDLSVPAAAKTGTTDDFRDSWTIGYTTSLVTGVWVGNSRGEKMEGVAGSSGAGTIWHDFMEKALPLMKAEGKAAQPFPQPAGLVEVEVCAVSGQRPTADCPNRRKELFLAGSEPRDTCSVHKKVAICQVSGKLAGDSCPSNAVEQKLFEIYPSDGREWAQARNIAQPPADKCTVHTGHLQVAFSNPQEGQEVAGTVAIRGTAEMSDMQRCRVEYGISDNPQGWGQVQEFGSGGIHDGHLADWSTTRLPNGVYTLRIVVFDSRGNSQEARVHVRVLNSTPTPTPTITSTPTPRATETVRPTHTSPAKPTHTPSEAPTRATPPATETPAPTSTRDR